MNEHVYWHVSALHPEQKNTPATIADQKKIKRTIQSLPLPSHLIPIGNVWDKPTRKHESTVSYSIHTNYSRQRQ